MKIVCECGNEATFNTKDDETGKENPVYEDEGQFARLQPRTFRFWEMHDQVGIVCEKCDKGVNFFT